MHQLIAKSGEEGFSQHVTDILSARIDDRLVLIKPNGLIYVSHPHYRERLDRAFGVGGWCLVPLALPHVERNRVIYHGFLKAGGRFIADAIGGQPYFPNNAQMNYDDAIEGAKSDCLVRCCKSLPMFRECWDAEYADYWKATHAEQVRSTARSGEVIWRKKGEAKRGFSARPDRDPQSPFEKPPRVEDENNAHLEAMRREAKAYIITSGEELQGDEFYDDSRE